MHKWQWLHKWHLLHIWYCAHTQRWRCNNLKSLLQPWPDSQERMKVLWKGRFCGQIFTPESSKILTLDTIDKFDNFDTFNALDNFDTFDNFDNALCLRCGNTIFYILEQFFSGPFPNAVFVYFVFVFLVFGNIIFDILDRSSSQKYIIFWVFPALRHML